MKNLGRFLTIGFFVFVFGTFSNASDTKISSWKSLGTRWAEALDDSGNTLAIYDLSFPQFFGPFPIGEVMGNKITFSKAIADAKAVAQTQTDTQSVSVFNQLNAISDNDLQKGNLSDGWWKDIPWKTAARAKSDAAPKSFKLSEIDFSQATNNFTEFTSRIQKIEEATEEPNGDLIFGGNLLDQFEYQMQDDGSYKIFWKPSLIKDSPQKIVDFTNSKSLMYVNFAWQGVHSLFGLAIGAINVPVVAALVATAVDAVYYFHDDLQKSHQEMLAEMIYTRNEKVQSYSPLASYSDDKLTQSKIGIFYSETGLGDVWNWLIADPLSTWNQNFSDDQSTASAGLDWLKQNQSTVTPLNSRFAISTDAAGAKKISTLTFRADWEKTMPAVAVDYSHPQDIHNARLEKEIEYFVIDFGTRLIPVPYVGTVVSFVYGKFVDDPIRTEKLWEARLQAHLEERQASGGENWSSEIDSIESQKINPFELSKADADALVAKRKLALNINQ